MLIHTDEKPLRCDWEGCGKTFRQQSALSESFLPAPIHVTYPSTPVKEVSHY